MARVTKINVGGTNYDIAHEGELKNSGFEVVTSLPTTGLFDGREVIYKGIKYVYNKGWVSQYNPVNFPKGVTLQSSTEELTNASTVIELQNFEFAQIPELLNKSLFISNNTNVVKQSERLYELIDNETGDITVLSGITDPVLGQTLRYTAINPSGTLDNLYLHIIKTNSTSDAYCVYIPQSMRRAKAVYKIEYYIYTNVIGDGDYRNKANYEWKTVFEKELKQYSEVIYPCQGTIYFAHNTKLTYTYIFNVRVSVTPTTEQTPYSIDIIDIDILYYGENHKSPVYANRLINFDAVIEPTQTSTEFKSPLWLWQYLTQGVNWLKAKKLDKRSYNHVYTNCGYTNIVSSTTGALIIELPFAPTNDTNNSLTYIELNVYSYGKGCSKYIISSYSQSNNLVFEWSSYSYIGYNYFSSITQARRTDNHNIVIVLGEFTDVHVEEHFSISRIVTGYTRSTDDTDQFLMYIDSTSSNYTALKDSKYIPQVISYNDLTDTPTIPSTFADLGGNVAAAQISEGSIANSKLINSSMTLNDTTVNLGDTANVPWYLDYNEVDYPARLRDHWLQIYRNGVWANLMYLGDILPTQVGQITSLDSLDWYNEQVSEYEVDSNTTTSILNGTTLPATVLMNCLAERLTLNLYPISGKQYGKGSLDSLISDLQGKGFSVFVENDLDAIIGSGSDYLVRIKISKVPTTKAIIECYVAR